MRRPEPDGAPGSRIECEPGAPTSSPQWFALKPRRCWGFFYMPVLRAPIRRLAIGPANVGLALTKTKTNFSAEGRFRGSLTVAASGSRRLSPPLWQCAAPMASSSPASRPLPPSRPPGPAGCTRSNTMATVADRGTLPGFRLENDEVTIRLSLPAHQHQPYCGVTPPSRTAASYARPLRSARASPHGRTTSSAQPSIDRVQ
jgi:hypothetical protein